LDIIVRLIAIVVVAYLVYELLLRRKADFVIRVRGDRVSFKGNFPDAQRAAMIHFLSNDAAIRGPCKVFGSWKAGRASLWFSGQISEREKQRVRNLFSVGL
jgi:hypothetical protein